MRWDSFRKKGIVDQSAESKIYLILTPPLMSLLSFLTKEKPFPRIPPKPQRPPSLTLPSRPPERRFDLRAL
jgi:hypothetical protein